MSYDGIFHDDDDVKRVFTGSFKTDAEVRQEFKDGEEGEVDTQAAVKDLNTPPSTLYDSESEPLNFMCRNSFSSHLISSSPQTGVGCNRSLNISSRYRKASDIF